MSEPRFLDEKLSETTKLRTFSQHRLYISLSLSACTLVHRFSHEAYGLTLHVACLKKLIVRLRLKLSSTILNRANRHRLKRLIQN